MAKNVEMRKELLEISFKYQKKFKDFLSEGIDEKSAFKKTLCYKLKNKNLCEIF
jgi:hypothetical protein